MMGGLIGSCRELQVEAFANFTKSFSRTANPYDS